jgi:hypothetical protein
LVAACRIVGQDCILLAGFSTGLLLLDSESQMKAAVCAQN